MLRAPGRLADHHDLALFSCGELALDDWLKSRARKSEGRFARTYAVCDDDRVAAYFCITVGSVERANVPSKIRRNAPDPIPIALIGRLAVDIGYAGRGLGRDILQDAFRRIAAASEQIGISAVLLHAKTEAAMAFYMKQAEFLEYPTDSRTLYLPIETLIATL